MTQSATEPSAPDHWPTATPGDVGVDADWLTRCQQDIAARRPEVHSLLIARAGRLVWETYREGTERDVIWSAGIPDVYGCSYKLAADKDQPHPIKSCTKSILATLAGIALARGHLKTLDATIGSYLPDYFGTSKFDKRKQAITLHDLLRMRSGLYWEENAQITLDWIAARDPIHFTLAHQDLISVPGERWEYSTADSHLLSVCLSRAVGQDLQRFAQDNLFGPLGFSPSRWLRDGCGRPIGGSELFLRSREMLSFGQLCLRRGKWRNRRVVPEAWIEAMATAQPDLDSAFFDARFNPGSGQPLEHHHDGYGLQWWTTSYHGHRAFSAQGYGGQQIAVIPELDLVVVTTMSTDDVADTSDPLAASRRATSAVSLIDDFVVPAVSGTA